MKLMTLTMLVAIAAPAVALADSSQPNSAPGLEGRPLTTQGEGTTGTGRADFPGTRGVAPTGTTGSGGVGEGRAQFNSGAPVGSTTSGNTGGSSPMR